MKNLVTFIKKVYLAGWMTVTSRFPIGTNIFSREWDMLIVLDTCRVDALEEVADEYDFINDINAITSVGSTSREWMANTFTTRYEREIANTAYISANAFTKRVILNRTLPAEGAPVNWNVVQPEDFLLLDNAWEYQPDDKYKHMLPGPLTDRAISVRRDLKPKRLLIHYLQPHAPFIAKAKQEGRELLPHEENPFDCLREGRVDRKTVWKSYIDNLRFALDSVDLLLNNLDAETVVITSDHGEAFGLFGIYGHPAGSLHPKVKRVPWVETTAKDKGVYKPSFGPDETAELDVEDQLRDLGYL